MHVESHPLHETAQDFHEHRTTYDGFLRLSAIAAAWTLTVVVGLALGGTAGRWGLCLIFVTLGTIAAGLGIAVRDWGWKPGATVLVLGLLSLLLVSY